MAIAWILRLKGVTSVLVGTSKVKQVIDNVAALSQRNWTEAELKKIDDILT
jgi:L-glyceraldehyde 3-phosphate reductase